MVRIFPIFFFQVMENAGLKGFAHTLVSPTFREGKTSALQLAGMLYGHMLYNDTYMSLCPRNGSVQENFQNIIKSYTKA